MTIINVTQFNQIAGLDLNEKDSKVVARALLVSTKFKDVEGACKSLF